MGITDKISGRVKKAAGDLADDSSLRRQGRQEERKGEAKEELAQRSEHGEDGEHRTFAAASTVAGSAAVGGPPLTQQTG